ncbi:MAG: hypothetical protein ACK42H_12960 [Planctomycetota bacterium]|jgi:hypothetical protein
MNSILFDLLLYCGTVAIVVLGICTAVGVVAMIQAIKRNRNDRNDSCSEEVTECK